MYRQLAKDPKAEHNKIMTAILQIQVSAIKKKLALLILVMTNQ
jgi:hypothetical protein